jgi:amino acid adenylation domain-containing protein
MNESTFLKEEANVFNPFEGPTVERIIYTTQSQAEIWIACKLGDIDANRAYNESVSLILKGNLNKEAIQNAIQNLVERHESLRSVFSTDGRFMTVFEYRSVDIDYQDLSELSVIEKEKTLKNYLLTNANAVFDLVKGPLFKVGLIQFSETEHHLILTAHHIICDGWSIGIMLEELGSLYSAYILNTNHNLPKPESFCEYADAQQAYLVSDSHKANENFWLNQFKDLVPQLTLPTDFPRPQIRTFKSERLDFSMKPELLDALKKTGVKAGCSFVTTLLSVFEILLYTQTGQDDLVLGLPSADQAASGKTQMIGHCVNLLPLRSKIDVNISFSDYLKQRKPQLFDAYDHQQLSFGELLQKLSIARDPSRIPLVPVVFNIDMGMTSAVSFSNLIYKLKSNPRTYETFEIFLNATGTDTDLILEWQYNSNLFKSETIQMMMTTLENIITVVVANPNIKIGDIIKVDDTAYINLNSTKEDYPQLPLPELILTLSQNYNQNIAIKFGNDEISYINFNQKVNQLSHALIKQGVLPGHIIAVALPRTTELVITLIAIMRCGAAYLPLDPDYPKKRLEFMLLDSEANLLITSRSFSDILVSASTVFIEDLFLNLEEYPIHPISLKIDNTQIAYILYTSGSTGQPKGVPISHKNLVNFLYSMMKAPGISETDRLLSITTISFDIAGLELYLPLLSGATLVIANEETAKDGRLLLEFLEEESITILQATPSTWQMLFDSGWVKPLSIKALCGGEQLPMALAKKILTRVDELWNMYGPTETTIWSTTKQILKDDELLTIGKPIANTQVYILNQQGLLMKPGSIGEIVIGGDGVAEGYWKRADLSAQKFILNEFDLNSKTKLYRTGDLGRLLHFGEIQCLGRMDDQVKIRGHRIELGEIEEAINSLENIASSVVLIDQDRLKAFITFNGTKDESDDLVQKWRVALKDLLPQYMIPHEFVCVNEFPKTLNGKIDRKSLLKNSNPSPNNSRTHILPRTITEQLVANIWERCLNIKEIDIFSNFFELGGHSLIAVRIMSQLEKETGERLPLAALMTHSTIEKLAQFIDKDNKPVSWNSLVPIQPKGTKTPLYVVHGADHNVMIFKLLSNNLDVDQPLYGLQAKGLNGIDEPHETVEEMAAHYISEIIKSNPKGPYAIAGYSFGGIIAFEMARQLKAANRRIKILVLLDSYVYPSYYHDKPLSKKIASAKYILGMILFMIKKMFSSKENFKNRLQLMKKSINNTYLRLKYGKEKQHELLKSWPFKLDKMHRAAINSYHITPFDLEVDLLKVAEDDVFYSHDNNLLGWDSIALGGVNKHIIPGNHINMLSQPNIKELGKIIQNMLDMDNEKF